MPERILITGGAGFIGSHLADELLAHGYRVRVLDCLDPQVHGPDARPPAYLSPEVEFVQGDVRDAAAVRRALDGIDAVYHFAAAVGVGQSMYEIEKYTDINNRGTAVLLENLLERPVRRLIVASSMSLYGEGLYRDADGKAQTAAVRPLAQLKAGHWEPEGLDGLPLRPAPTPEDKTPAPTSVYALSKYDQEKLCLLVGQAYHLPTVALRFFNVYGTRQALSNPYTGVLAIFSSRYLNGKPPLIFEDGRQRRDFVSVRDVARACRLALTATGVEYQAFNIGSGQAYSINEIAERIRQVLGLELAPNITGRYRVGDIRHCYADIDRARRLLGYTPAVTLDDGLSELADWLAGQPATDAVETATAELTRRGLRL